MSSRDVKCYLFIMQIMCNEPGREGGLNRQRPTKTDKDRRRLFFFINYKYSPLTYNGLFT